MKSRCSLPLLLLSLAMPVLVAPAATPPSPSVATLAPDDSQAQAAMWATRFLTRFHYKRVPLDDAMSSEILDRYLEALDGDKLFFLNSDITGFERFRHALDDGIYDGVEGLTPPFEIFRVYAERVAARTRHARALLEKGFDFGVDERYVFDREDAPYATTAAELDELWRKRVKNDWLRLKLNGKAAEEIRKTLDKRYRGFAERVKDLDGEDVFQTYMNAYATAIEPHTSYLGPRASENFTIQMKLSLEGIGAVLAKDEDYTIVRTIVKGGPADKSDRLEVGDRIVGVGQGGKGPVQDVIGWRLDDVVDMIRGPKGTTVLLDVLPRDASADAKPVHLTLVREQVKLEEQAAKKHVIELENGAHPRRIGVISLPAFYHDFEGHRRGDADYRSSTRDVAKLLTELRGEGVEGVVLDLRDNGGGSLTEATNLTGLFIDRGPVVQVRDAQGRISVEADSEAGVVWDGPLAVLVNRSSASASEILAAALQDYGRALIIGETTYGKGTVQNLVDLDNVAQSEHPVFGQLKLTVAQFFRVNGGSTQHRGVVPDVAFPPAFDPSEWGESMHDNALPWTSITPADFQGQGNFLELVPMLETRHGARVGKDREFQYWLEDLAEYKRIRGQKEVSLLENARKAERDQLDARRKQRQAERAAAAGSETAASKRPDREDALVVDDGLQADERLPINQGDDEIKDDVPLTEAAHVLGDAITLLSSDRRLAQRVKAFNLAETPPQRVN
jgi:carboxyl-terminal processing protease